MNTPVISPQTRLMRIAKLPEAQLSPQDTVLLDANQGLYYGLEGPAREIWDLLETEMTLAELCTRLTGIYDVDEATCMKDTRAFVEQMIETGLVSAR